METNFESLEKAHSMIARERVLQDLKILARDAEDLMKATAGDLSERANAARARLGGALASARATCNELQAEVVASAKAATRRADTLIRANPYASAGMAFGIGVLIGVLAVRR